MSDNNNSKNNNKKQHFNNYISVENLFKLQFEDDKFIVADLVPEGSLVLLSARPKAGKTNLALQMACAIASGKFFLSFRTEKKKVLFISLELNMKQMKRRLANVLNYLQIKDLSFKKFPFVLRFSSEKNGLNALKEELNYLCKVYRIKFDIIFIDTYVLFKDIEKEAVKKHKSVYEIESEYLARLRKFCEETNTTIVLIYHNRKAQAFSGDITENIMGSTGIAGAVNEILLLERRTGEDRGKLIATGHNIEEQTIELEFKNGLFELLTGSKKELRLAEKIVEYLKQVKTATKTEIYNHLKAIGETRSKGDVFEVLDKFDTENNKNGYWKHIVEKRSRGKPKHIYSLEETKETKQENIFEKSVEELEGLDVIDEFLNDEIEDLEISQEDLDWLNDGINID